MRQVRRADDRVSLRRRTIVLPTLEVHSMWTTDRLADSTPPSHADHAERLEKLRVYTALGIIACLAVGCVVWLAWPTDTRWTLTRSWYYEDTQTLASEDHFDFASEKDCVSSLVHMAEALAEDIKHTGTDYRYAINYGHYDVQTTAQLWWSESTGKPITMILKLRCHRHGAQP